MPIDNLIRRCHAEAAENCMKKVTAVLLILLLLCATSAIAQEKLEPSAAAKATLLKLFQLSNQQALQSPVARNLLTGEALEWKMPGF